VSFGQCAYHFKCDVNKQLTQLYTIHVITKIIKLQLISLVFRILRVLKIFIYIKQQQLQTMTCYAPMHCCIT